MPPRDVREPDRNEAPRSPWRGTIEHFGIEAGAGILNSVGGLDASLAPVLRGWVHLAWGASARLSLAGPAFGPDVRAAAGVASVRQELATLGVAYVFSLPARWLAPILSLGAGAYHLHAHGAASGSYVGTSADSWAAVFDGGAGVAVRVAERFAFVADVHAMVAAPRPLIAIGDATTSAGRPLLLDTLTGVLSF